MEKRYFIYDGYILSCTQISDSDSHVLLSENPSFSSPNNPSGVVSTFSGVSPNGNVKLDGSCQLKPVITHQKVRKVDVSYAVA